MVGEVPAFEPGVVPSLDVTYPQASHQRLATGYCLTLAYGEMIKRYYLTSLEEEANPYVSPLLAPALSGLHHLRRVRPTP